MSQPPGPQGPYQPFPEGQQPGGDYPQQGGHQQQGQPPQGGYPQQGQPPQGPPPGQYGPPGGYDPYGEPGGKKKSPMPWILGGVGALVIIAGVILLIVLLGGGGGAGSPDELADQVVAGFNERDADGLTELGCGQDSSDKAQIEEGFEKFDLSKQPGVPEEMKQVKVRFEKGEVKESGDTATAQLKILFDGVPEQFKNTPPFDGSQSFTLQLADDGGWCVKDLQTPGG